MANTKWHNAVNRTHEILTILSNTYLKSTEGLYSERVHHILIDQILIAVTGY